jgi:hypothetical protein
MLHHGAILCSESNETRFSCIDYAGDLIVAGNAHGAIFFYKLESRATRLRPKLTLHVAPPANDKSLHVPLTCIRFSPCQRYLSVGTASGTVLVFNLTDSSRLDIKCHYDDHNGNAISSLCWSSNSSKLFSGCIGGAVIELILSDAITDKGLSLSLTSAMALHFASALLMGRKATTLICQCEEIIRQIECTFSENCSCGCADVLLVSVAHHSLLFQLPIDKKLTPRFCDIVLNGKVVDDKSTTLIDVESKARDDHFDELWCAGCFCNSYLSTRELDHQRSMPLDFGQIRATGIMVAQSCESGIELVYCSIDGKVQQSFKLDGPYRTRKGDESWDRNLGMRCLKSFSGDAHKHLMTLITTDNSIMLINLQDMSCDYLLSHFDYSVHAAVPNGSRLSVLYHTEEVVMADVLECLSPVSPKPPLKIFDSHLHLALSVMKEHWKLQKLDERETDTVLLTPQSLNTHFRKHDSFKFSPSYDPNDAQGDMVCSVMLGGNKPPVGPSCRTKSHSTPSEKMRQAMDLAMKKKMENLDKDLNRALSHCDEELESWAFDASAGASIIRGKSEFGGGGGGERTLDDIAEYGAILDSSQGVGLSEEAISQLASLQKVLTSECETFPGKE